MKKMILLSVVSLALLAVKAQTADSLIGHWQFKDIYKPEQLDSVKLERLRTVFSELSFHLKADHKYSALLFEEEEGTWSYKADRKQLIFKNDKGQENEMDIIQVSATQLVISLGDNKMLAFQKITGKVKKE